MNKIEEILNMVKNNTISIEEAQKLITALESNEVVAKLNPPTKIDEDYRHKMLKVFVDSIDGDKVKINIPVALVLAGIDLAAKFNNVNINERKLDMSEIDFELIKECLYSGMLGEIISVESANGDRIRIFVE
ncbi:MAG: hypothetical protein PHP11_02660 [Erysipelotrichaceae bacterium]|jgi:hypothetical protein|nr:hypothetical protein [Erysipelotrichaceae bacterium]MDD3923985.1 hypothetical protein [Erysipelotrichaceae bacterium]MDD4643014.1 hypothetical protein [Erysipelotrichaceae bacterium]